VIKVGSFLETRIFQMLCSIVFLSFLSVVLTAPISPKATAAGLLLASGLTSSFHVGQVFPGSRSVLQKAAILPVLPGSLQTVPRSSALFEGNDGYGPDDGWGDDSVPIEGGSGDGSEFTPFVKPEDFDQVGQSSPNC
jgi:hypothetical protein